MRLSKSPVIRWTHLFQFILKGFYWLIILESLVNAVKDSENSENSRSFHQVPLPFHVQKNSPLPNLAPTSYSHLQHGKGDLTSEAQTLYDLRGYHIPLGGAEETKEYLRQQNQQSPSNLRQTPFVFPSYFQTQNYAHHHQLNNQEQQSQHTFHAQQNFRTQSESPTSSALGFKPSQQDLGKSTTEDAFKPFNPPNLIEQKQYQTNTYQPQHSQQQPYIYVYDDADYEVEVSKTPIQPRQQNGRNERNKQQSIHSTVAAPLQTTTSQPATAQYEFFEEEEQENQDPSNDFYNSGLTNNNLPFNRFVDDHSQSGSFIPGRHYTNDGPNIEIIPSSERKPPPNARNTVPALLTKDIKQYDNRARNKIQIPVFDDGPQSRPTFEENLRKPTNRPVFEENHIKPSNGPVFQEHHLKPSNRPVFQEHHLKPSNRPIFEENHLKPSNPSVFEENHIKPSNGPIFEEHHLKPSNRPVFQEHHLKPSNRPVFEENRLKPSNPPVFEENNIKPSNGPAFEEHHLKLSNRPVFPENHLKPTNRPVFQQFPPATRQHNNNHRLIPEYNPPQLFNQPFNFQSAPNNEREVQNLINLPKNSRFKNVKPTQSSRPVQINEHLKEDGEQYNTGEIQKFNSNNHRDPFHSSQKHRPENTIVLQSTEDYVSSDTYDIDGNVLLEEELPSTTTTTKKTTTTSTTPPPTTKRVTLKPRSRLPFPPFAGRHSTSSTTSTTTTFAPRIRMTRPRLRPKTTTATTTRSTTTSTTTTTPAPTPIESEYYDFIEPEQLQGPTHNSVEQEQQQEQFNKQIQPVTYKQVENGREETPHQNSANVFNKAIRGRYRHQHSEREREHLPQQQLVGFRQNDHFNDNHRFTQPSPTPTAEQQIYEETPSIQVKTRTRLVNPTPTIEQQIYEGTPFIQKTRARIVNPTPTIEQQIYEETPSIQVKTRTRIITPTPTHSTVFKSLTNQRQPNTNRFLDRPSQPPPRQQQGHELHFIPDFSPFPESPRQQPYQIPRGRKQPPGHMRLHPQHHPRVGGKPLYISGKMLEKEGGLYAGYEVHPQHHAYGYGLPLPFIQIPISPSPPPVEPSRQPIARRPQFEFPRQRERERAHLQLHHPRPLQSHVSELRRPLPTIGHPTRPEAGDNVNPFRTEEEIEIPKPRARLRLSSPSVGRRRKPKSDDVDEAEPQQGPHDPEEVETIVPTPKSPFIAENEAKLRHQPLPLVIHEEFSPTPNPLFHPSRETSPSSSEIELPAIPKPNPLKRRPLQRIRIPGTLAAHATTQTTTTTTEIPVTIPTTTTSKAVTKLRPRPRLMRPLKEIEQVDVIVPTVSHPVKNFRKPTQAYAKFSSRYREEDIIFVTPPPTLPTIAVEETQPSFSSLEPLPAFVAKPRPVIKIKKKPKVITESPTTTNRFVVTENSSPTIPTSILLTPRDVLQNRKPARRIPPGSASDRLKVLQDRRRQLFKTRVAKPAVSLRQEEEFEGEDQEPEGSNLSPVQSKREIRIDKIENGIQKYRKSERNSSETTSEEMANVLGIPKPVTTTESQTEFHLLWEEVGSASVPPLSSLAQQLSSKTGISVPIIEFNANVRDEINPMTTSESPFNIFQISNQNLMASKYSQSIPILSTTSSKVPSLSLNNNWNFKF